LSSDVVDSSEVEISMPLCVISNLEVIGEACTAAVFEAVDLITSSVLEGITILK